MPASYIDYDHIQIGTLPVTVKSVLKSKSTSRLDQCLLSLYLTSINTIKSVTDQYANQVD